MILRKDRHTPLALVASLGLITAAAPGASVRDQPGRRPVLVVPSREFPTVQEAIDGASQGAVIRVLPGVYRLTEGLWVRAKNLTLEGGGAFGDRRTELVGPLPTAGYRVPEPEAAVGVVNSVDSSLQVRHLRLRGFDAGIIGRQTGDTRRPDLAAKITNTAIRDTGRGILWKAHGKLTVADTEISNTAWNGISLAPRPALSGSGTLLNFVLEKIVISDFANAGIVYIDDPGVCDDDHTVKNAVLIGGGGPAVLAIRSGVCILDSHIAIPRTAGVVALSAAVLVKNTKIFFPLPTPDGRWGTGIIASAFGSGRSLVTVIDNEIKNVERDFITNLGSDVVFNGNELVCREDFDLVGLSHLGFGFTFSGPPAQCSDECPAQLGVPPLAFRDCKVEGSLTPEAPAPAVPIE